MNDALLSLPDDVAEGFEQMKLSILRHKLDGWNEISEDQIVMVLWALIQIAVRKDGGEERCKR